MVDSEESCAEKTYAPVLGGVLTSMGILGYIPGLTPGGYLFGSFASDGVHNGVHLLLGSIGLAVGLAPAARYARWYALAVALVYGLVTIIGFVQGTTVLGLFRVNGADNVLHLLIAVGALAIYGISEHRKRQVARAVLQHLEFTESSHSR